MILATLSSASTYVAQLITYSLPKMRVCEAIKMLSKNYPKGFSKTEGCQRNAYVTIEDMAGVADLYLIGFVAPTIISILLFQPLKVRAEE